MMIKTTETFLVNGTKAVVALAHLTLHQKRDALGLKKDEDYNIKKAIELLTDAIKGGCDTEGEFLATYSVACGMAYGESTGIKEEVEAARKLNA